MFNFIAVALATFIIPTSPANTILTENYSIYNPPIGMISNVKTPNGSEVPIQYCKEEGDEKEINRTNQNFLNYFNIVYYQDYTIELINKGGYYYNNFAYAFYMYWGGDISCIIEDPNPFIADKSYIEVATPQTDDIVCYRAGDNILHAGIIKDVLNEFVNADIGSNLIVESKWFNYGVFKHRGDLCPYTHNYNMMQDVNVNTVEGADNVVYFRRHEAHNYKVVEGSNIGDVHTLKCECGNEKTEKHTYSYSSYNFKTHERSCPCGEEKFENHVMVTMNGERYCRLCFYYPFAINPALTTLEQYLE